MTPYRLVLTGAGGGLGRSIALALCEHAGAMVLCGRDKGRLMALRAQLLERRPGLSLALVSGDLAQDSTRGEVFAAAQAQSGGVNLLINNAGIGDFHEFESQSPQAVERLLMINLLAPMLLTQCLLPLLRQAPRAQVVNVGSIFGYLGYPGNATYCASKFGLRGFSQALRRELAGGSVEVRYFAPRAIDTPLNSAAVTELNRELGNAQDPPAQVAQHLLRFLRSGQWECRLGFPERLFVLINRLFPAITDRAMRAQLDTIRNHLPAAGGRPNIAQERGQ